MVSKYNNVGENAFTISAKKQSVRPSDKCRNEEENLSRRSVPLPINRFGLEEMERSWSMLSECQKDKIGETCLSYLYL